jgi:hypothetical protein
LADLVIAGRPYTDVADLARVRGISDRQVEELRAMLTVSGATRTLDAVPDSESVEDGANGRWPEATLVTYAVAALVVIVVIWPWLNSQIRRRRNARTRAAFEEAERRRWEGHKRK